MYREGYEKIRQVRQDTFVDDLFRIINERIDTVIKNQRGEGDMIDALSRMYWDSWWGVKFLSGTSAGWPWLAEYVIFYIIKKRISDAIGIHDMVPFLPSSSGLPSKMNSSKSVWSFVDQMPNPQFALKHNAYLTKNIQPDITLFRGDELLFTVDVKVGVVGPKVMIDSLFRIRESVEKFGTSKTQGYLVSLTRYLSFDNDKVRPEFAKFNDAGCYVVGPAEGPLLQKLVNMGGQLVSLERCLDMMCRVL